MPGTAVTLNESGLQAELNRALDQMHRINLSIGEARKRGDTATVDTLLAIYKTWLARYKEVAKQLGQADFSAFDRFVLNTGTYVSDAVNALPDAAAALPAAIGKGLLKGALPFALLAAAYLFFRGKL